MCVKVTAEPLSRHPLALAALARWNSVRTAAQYGIREARDPTDSQGVMPVCRVSHLS